MGTDGQTNMHTNIHTHTFRRTISVNQARTHSRPSAGCERVPGLKSIHQETVCCGIFLKL